jgi:hypothetical protein
MTVVFWVVIVPLTIAAIVGMVQEHRLEKRCREEVERFLNHEE